MRLQPCIEQPGTWILIPVLCIVLSIIFMAVAAGAEDREIVADGEYIMGDGETMSVAEERARMNAVQKAAEQAGAFVLSYTRMRDMVVEEDMIEVIANHVMKITMVSKKREMAGDAVRFTVRIKAAFSAADIEANLTRLADEREAATAYRNLKAAFDRQAKELEALKRQLAAAPKGARKAVLEKIGENEQRFRATLFVEEGYRKLAALDNSGADASFSRAIELDPSLAKAYAARAEARLFYAEMDALLSDADRAVSLEPENARFYAVRARVRAFHQCTEQKKSGCEAVFSDLVRASELDPKNPDYPIMLGKMYGALGQYDRAVHEYDRAVKMHPSLTMPLAAVNTYLARAEFFLEEGGPGYLQKALADLDRAVEIITGPAYLNEETRKFARLSRERPQSEQEAFRVFRDIFGIDFAALGEEEKSHG